MAKYRKKPMVVEASQWERNGDHPQDGPVDQEGKVVRYFRRPDRPGDSRCDHCDWTMHAHGWIDTLEGGHIVCPGDWIITGVAGERYPCKPTIFEASYEPVPWTPDDPTGFGANHPEWNQRPGAPHRGF